MDQPGLDPGQHGQALQALARINYFSRTASTLWPGLVELSRRQGGRLRLLDLASGGGDVLVRLARRAQRAGLSWHMAGCDFKSQAVTMAKAYATACGAAGVEFFVHDVLRDPFPAGFDAVVSSLFLHHLDEEDGRRLLASFASSACRLVQVSDLVRSLAGLVLAHVAGRLLTTSSVVHSDGPRSVEAAYTPAELRILAENAGLHGAVVTRRWPCRMLLTWWRPEA